MFNKLKAAFGSQEMRFDAEQLNLKAAFNEGDDPDVRPFEMVAYSGGTLNVSGFPHPVVVDLRGVDVKAASGSKLPITLDHQDSQRVGHADNVNVGNTSITLDGVTSAASSSRDEVLASHRQGFRFQGSIEGVTKNKELVAKGKSVRVNGRSFSGPVIVARRFTLRAVSFVSAGGDEENQVRLAASNGDPNMDPQYEGWLAELGLTPDMANDQLKAKYESEIKAKADTEAAQAAEAADAAVAVADPPVDPTVTSPTEILANVEKKFMERQKTLIEEGREEAAKEAEYRLSIEKVCAGHTAIFAKCMRENLSKAEAEVLVLKAEREDHQHSGQGGQGPAIHSSSYAEDVTGQVIEAALLRTDGFAPNDMGYADEVCDKMDKHMPHEYGLHTLMYDTIYAAGKHWRSGSVGPDCVRIALEADKELSANAGFSTISMTDTLSNVANKTLLSAYDSIEGVIRTFSSSRPVNDFKEVTMYRMTGIGDLQKLGADGEIKHTEVGDEVYRNQIDTYARMMALTRQMMINDDLHAFLQIPQKFGRAAARTEEKLGWFTLLNSIASGFFTIPKRNMIATGAGSALTHTSLTDSRKLFSERKDADGEFIMLQGRYLIVAPANEDNADSLMNDSELMMENRDTTATTPNKTTMSNPHKNRYTPLSSPYFGAESTIEIDGVTVTGSDDHFIVAGDPNDAPLLEFAHLRGQTQPMFESAETDFNTLGVRWRIVRDFGWAPQDDRGGVYSQGN